MSGRMKKIKDWDQKGLISGTREQTYLQFYAWQQNQKSNDWKAFNGLWLSQKRKKTVKKPSSNITNIQTLKTDFVRFSNF